MFIVQFSDSQFKVLVRDQLIKSGPWIKMMKLLEIGLENLRTYMMK